MLLKYTSIVLRVPKVIQLFKDLKEEAESDRIVKVNLKSDSGSCHHFLTNQRRAMMTRQLVHAHRCKPAVVLSNGCNYYSYC